MNKWKHSKNTLSDSVRKYLYSPECRRAFILSYFGEKYEGENKRCCDNCYFKFNSQQENCIESIGEDGKYDFTEDAEKMLKSVEALQGRYGLTIYVLFLRGSKSNKLKEAHKKHNFYGCGKDKNENWWKSICNILLQEEYIMKKDVAFGGFTNYVFDLTEKGKKFLEQISKNRDAVKLKLKPQLDILEQINTKPKMKDVRYNKEVEAQSSSKAVLIENMEKSKEEELDTKLYNLMIEERCKIAEEKDCMPHNIISIPDIRQIIKIKPRSLQQLKKCKFAMFSEIKISQFGQQFIDLIVKQLGPCKEEYLDEEKIDMVQALLKIPLLETSNASTQISYNLFRQGRSIEEISEMRVMSQNTIFSHLLDNMKKGLPIRMEQMGVDKTKALIILRVILETPGQLLTPIKEKCSPDISWNDIKVVMTYNNVRNHLIQHGILYNEFEDFSYESLESEAGSLDLEKFKDDIEKSSVPVTNEDQNLSELLRVSEDMIKRDEAMMRTKTVKKNEDTCLNKVSIPTMGSDHYTNNSNDSDRIEEHFESIDREKMGTQTENKPKRADIENRSTASAKKRKCSESISNDIFTDVYDIKIKKKGN